MEDTNRATNGVAAFAWQEFTELTYDDFKHRALDKNLSRNEKIGFPDSYRDGFEDAIVGNILVHLPAMLRRNKVVLDLGCGCGPIAEWLIGVAERNGHTLLLSDSEEMLALLPESRAALKMPGFFPESMAQFEGYLEKVDAVIAYSVLQHVALKHSLYAFLDSALSLLAPGGTLLIGDIPNSSKRERLFASEAGRIYHRQFTGTITDPPRAPLTLKPNTLDDGALFGILQRYRNAGFETYLLPQPDSLPMWNRREDIVITRW